MSNIDEVKITDKGITSPSYNEILDGTLDDINQALGGAMNKDITTPQGQIAVSMAWSINKKNEQLTYFANQFNPDFAEGRFQDALAAIYFIERKPAQGTIVTARCTGLVNTLIPKNSSAIDDSGYIYYSLSDATINQDGFADVVFVNQTTGSIPCVAGALNGIYKAVIGWDSVNNLKSGVLGRDIESRNDFEIRRRESVAGNSNNQNGSILSSVLAVDNVIDAYVYSNDSDAAIEYGATNYPIKPHSLCVSVFGGSDIDIATAIWKKKNAGCGMDGNKTLKVQDKDNYAEPYPTYLITYLEPTPTLVKFRISIQKDENLPAEITSSIIEIVKSVFTGQLGNNRARIGGRVIAGRYFAPISNLSEFLNIESVLISKDGVTYSSYIDMGIDEMPTVSDESIEVILNENR